MIGAFHTLLATAMAIVGGMLLAQGQLNVLWETSFYHQASAGTINMVVGSILLLLVAATEGTIGVSFAIGQRWAVHAQIFLSLVFMILAPSPMNAFMALAVGGGLLELVPPASETDDEEEEDE
jgi:uncharacterized membrane protein YdcZ (DUF606 family)